MKVRENTQPPEGPHFVDADGTRIEAPTIALLYPAIADSRARRGVPIGNVVGDFTTYICSRWPTACDKEPADFGFTDARPGITDLFHRLGIWVASLMQRKPQGGYGAIAESKATARMAVCMACPMHEKWGCGCGSDSRVEQALQKLSYARGTSPRGIVNHACLATGWGCSVACNLPLEELRGSDGKSITDASMAALNAPATCWVRQELAAQATT